MRTFGTAKVRRYRSFAWSWTVQQHASLSVDLGGLDSDGTLLMVVDVRGRRFEGSESCMREEKKHMKELADLVDVEPLNKSDSASRQIYGRFWHATALSIASA